MPCVTDDDDPLPVLGPRPLNLMPSSHVPDPALSHTLSLQRVPTLSSESIHPSVIPGPSTGSTPSLTSDTLLSSLVHPPPAPHAVPSPLSSNPHILGLQQADWDHLVQKYGDQHLQRHPMWNWEGERWLPRYTYQTVHTISDIWEEWSHGLNGYLSTRELEEEWGAKWRRNNSGLKTENGQRKKVVQLIGDLSQKQGWNVQLALRFIQDKYEGPFTPRKFCEYLQTKSNAGYHEVLAAANVYT
jgi:hypothetical protein